MTPRESAEHPPQPGLPQQPEQPQRPHRVPHHSITTTPGADRPARYRPPLHPSNHQPPAPPRSFPDWPNSEIQPPGHAHSTMRRTYRVEHSSTSPSTTDPHWPISNPTAPGPPEPLPVARGRTWRPAPGCGPRPGPAVGCPAGSDDVGVRHPVPSMLRGSRDEPKSGPYRAARHSGRQRGIRGRGFIR